MKLSDNAKHILGTVAETLGTAIGGPFGALAGTAIAAALGTTAGDDKAAEAAIVGGNPDALAKLHQADLDFQAQMEKLGIERERLVYDDKANARAREIAVKDRTPAVLAYTITVGFFGTLGFMLVNGKPATGGDALLVMLGSLGTAWAGIVAYYFGSSMGSDSKSVTLAKIATSK